MVLIIVLIIVLCFAYATKPMHIDDYINVFHP